MEAKNPQHERMDLPEGGLGNSRPDYKTTEGEHLVGISFNPGGMAEVNDIKRVVADLIDYVRANGKDPRCTQICITELEAAAMWGVKSVTKRPRT